MPNGDAENRLDERSDTAKTAPETAIKEADEGRPGLAKAQKDLSDYLKSGGTSGITNEFGKPAFYDSVNGAGKADKIAAAVTDAGKGMESSPELIDKMKAAVSGLASDASKAVSSAVESAEKVKDAVVAAGSEAVDRVKAAAADLSKSLPPDALTDNIGAKTKDLQTTTDASGKKQADFTTPQGEHYHVGYGQEGNPNKITMPDANGKPVTYELRDSDGKWVNNATKPPTESDISGVSVTNGGLHIDRNNGTIPTGNETIYPDGRRETVQYDKNGAATEKHVRDADSHVEKVYKPVSEKEPSGYDVNDGSGHTRHVEKDGNGWKVSTGDQSQHFDKVEVGRNGDLKLSGGTDGATMEMRKDGSSNDIAVNDKDSSYTIGLENGGKATRKLDGTEEIKDKSGRHVDNEADKLIKDMKPPLNPEEARQFRADMAEVDKLPEAERKKVYDSLEKEIVK